MEGKKSAVGVPGKLRVPCIGFLAFLRPRDVMLLERRLKMDESSSLAPLIPTSAKPEGIKKSLPIVRHPSPTSPLDGSMSILSQGSSKSEEVWAQTETEVTIKCVLPRAAQKKDIVVDATSEHLCIKLGGSIVLQGRLRNKIDSSLTIWTIDREALCMDLLIVKAKKGHYWRSLFEGGMEKSHVAILQEALSSDEPLDDSPESRELLTELREKQRQVVNGQHSLEESFDDFRLVLGDEML